MKDKKINDKEICLRYDESLKRWVSPFDDIAKKKEDVLLKLNGVDCRRIVFLDDDITSKKVPLLDYYEKNVEYEEKIQKKILAKSLKPQYKGSIVDKK